MSAFAPDIRAIEGNAAFIAGYGAKFVSNFGPPAYVATQAAIAAIRKACADGDATRAEVQKHLRATFIPKIVLGGASGSPPTATGRARSSPSSGSESAAGRRWSASVRHRAGRFP